MFAIYASILLSLLEKIFKVTLTKSKISTRVMREGRVGFSFL